MVVQPTTTVGQVVTQASKLANFNDQAVMSIKEGQTELKCHHTVAQDLLSDKTLTITLAEGLFKRHLDFSQIAFPLYFERQEQPDTCFRHALNHYFQTQYISSSFLPAYKRLLKEAQNTIFDVKLQNMNASFYGNQEGDNGLHPFLTFSTNKNLR